MHGDLAQTQPETRTEKTVERTSAELLTELADLGFSWTAVARIVGVPTPTIRKWRQGEPAAGKPRRKLAGLVALAETLEHDHAIPDVASWLETPLAGTHHTGIDALVNGKHTDVEEYAAGHIEAAELLNRTQPTWKDTPQNQYEVFQAGDGKPAIRLVGEEKTGKA